MSKMMHPLFDLTDKVAIVTGGGSGLGREFCEILAEFGACVICADLHQDRAEETLRRLKTYGPWARAFWIDVSKYDQVQNLFREVEAAFGKLDILVNNAGIINRRCAIDEMNLEDWHKVQRGQC